jgi:hypothetical protein
MFIGHVYFVRTMGGTGDIARRRGSGICSIRAYMSVQEPGNSKVLKQPEIIKLAVGIRRK